jgi:hypothetical protein
MTPPGGGFFGGMIGAMDPAKAAAAKKEWEQKQQIVGDMAGNATPKQKQMISMGLMGWKNDELKKLKDGGVKIDVLKKDDFLAYDKQVKQGSANKLKEEALGYYNGGNKKLVLREDDLSSRVVSHEMGHALDDMRAPDAAKSKNPIAAVGRGLEKLGTKALNAAGIETAKENPVKWDSGNPEFKKLYDGYMKRTDGMDKEGGQLWSAYGRTNEREYFAEGMEFFKNPFKKEELKKNDPALFAYLSKVTG